MTDWHAPPFRKGASELYAWKEALVAEVGSVCTIN
jgi:hypothetical protein